MRKESGTMEIEICEMEQICGGKNTKEDAIKAIEKNIKIILGPVTHGWEEFFEKKHA